MAYQTIAAVCLGWFLFLTVVTSIGSVQIFRYYSRPPARPISSYLKPDHVPHVTVIRPCKGLEPFLYECLAAIFHQDYPSTHLTVHLCVSSKQDNAYAVLQQIFKDYRQTHDVRLYVEDEDTLLQTQDAKDFGPNPKIRNMSRAYREARGDVIWILDCNIWVGHGALGRIVDKLCGFTNPAETGEQAQKQRPYKLVAHLPVCVDVDKLVSDMVTHSRDRSVSSASVSATDDLSTVPSLFSTSSTRTSQTSRSSPWPTGSRLETSFLSTAHAKMYVAINSVSVAPCINGKSTIFRKSHLDHLTRLCHSPTHDTGTGIDHFSHNICEDHLIGDLLWKQNVPATLGFDRQEGQGGEIKKSNPRGFEYGNHGLAVGDLALQPVAGMTVSAYVARRVRWLRVRKFTVILATLVEPGTESLVCCAYGAFAVTTLDGLKSWFGSSWISTLIWWLVCVTYWATVDWFVSGCILGMGSVERIFRDGSGSLTVPPFAKPYRRIASSWFAAYVCREALALSIWTWAILGGATVTWREKRFWVGMDMRVHEVTSGKTAVQLAAGSVADAVHSTFTQNGNASAGGDGKASKAD